MKTILKPIKNKIPQVLLIFICIIVEVYCSLTLPVYTANIVDIGIKNTDVNYIIYIGSYMILMVGIMALMSILSSYFSSTVFSGYGRDLRRILYKKVLKFSNQELNNISKSSLITRSINDIDQLQGGLGMIFTTLVLAPILGVGSIIKAFEIGSDLSWIIIVTFIGINILFIIMLIRIAPYFRLMQELTDKVNEISREILIGIPVIKAYVRQDYEEKRFEKTNKQLFDTNRLVFHNVLIMIPLLSLILNVMIIFILYFGAYGAIKGSILTGQIIAFIQYSTQIVSSFLMLGGVMIILPRIIVSRKRVSEVLNTPLTIVDGEINQIEDNPILEFRNVSYKYPQSEKESVKNINFTLKPGKTTAIIGRTGSGKSTILNLIPRLQDPTSGEILINNINIKNFNLKTLRNKISYAPQSTFLFQESVKSNILIGKKNASDEEINNALKLAGADFINDIDSEVLQGGSNFSGGQKQRLSIARAIINEASFYLFDDCFSALDMNTERIVKNNIKNLLKDSSILIVSQRISTIMDADEIIVMDDGEILERGTHDELKKSCALYAEIVNSQIDNMKVEL